MAARARGGRSPLQPLPEAFEPARTGTSGGGLPGLPFPDHDHGFVAVVGVLGHVVELVQHPGENLRVVTWFLRARLYDGTADDAHHVDLRRADLAVVDECLNGLHLLPRQRPGDVPGQQSLCFFSIHDAISTLAGSRPRPRSSR